MSSFTNTSNLDLRDYDPVANPEWDHSDLVTAAEERLVLTDDDGPKSNFTPYATALYVDRSADEVYAGDGSAWNLVATRTESASDLSDVSADSVADAHHAAFEPTDHDGRDHAAALSSTFSPSDGDHIAFSSGSWTTEQPPSGGSGADFGSRADISSGSDLGAEINTALSNGNRTIVVHEPSDGSGWAWSTDVVVDTGDDSVQIMVDDSATIDYTGSGVMLTVEDSALKASGGGGFGSETRFRLVGGRWTASGSPTAMFRMDDQVGYYLFPRFLDIQGVGGGATAVEIRNVDGFSELGVIEGTYRAPQGIDFVPASVTGGDGTESFQGTTIRDVRVNVSETGGFGIRLRGDFRYNHIRRPNLFPNADDSDALVLATEAGGTGMLGTTITSFQAEASGSGSNRYAVRTAAPYDGFYGPLFVNPHAPKVDAVLSGDASDNRLPAIKYEADNIKIGNWGNSTWTDLSKDGTVSTTELTASNGVSSGGNITATAFNAVIEGAGGGPMIFNANGTEFLKANDKVTQFRMSPTDVTGVSSPERGDVLYNDGTAGTEGPAFYDGSGWTSLVDGSTIS